MESISQQDSSTLESYISQYRGPARLSRLLRLADSDEASDAKVSIEALKLCLMMSKNENQLA